MKNDKLIVCSREKRKCGILINTKEKQKTQLAL
jgi:hypothetical protein